MTFTVTVSPALAAPTDGQTDTFDASDVMGWQQGMVDLVVGHSDGGPQGAGDGYIEVTSIGGAGQNSRMSVFNMAGRWTGDWIGAGIGEVVVDLKNDSAAALGIRLKFESATGRAYSGSQNVPADGQWATYTFDLGPSSITAVGDPATILGTVTRFRIEHNPNGNHPPPAIAATLSIDNVTANAANWNCGNGTIEGWEVCDGSNLDSTTCADLPNFDDGTLACQGDCLAFDTTACTECGDGTCEGNETETSCPADCGVVDVCGDGQITGNEVCEPTDLRGQTCVSQGFDLGTLACAGGCESFDTSGCEYCLNGDCGGGDDGCGCKATGAGAAFGFGFLLLVLAVLPFLFRRRFR